MARVAGSSSRPGPDPQGERTKNPRGSSRQAVCPSRAYTTWPVGHVGALEVHHRGPGYGPLPDNRIPPITAPLPPGAPPHLLRWESPPGSGGCAEAAKLAGRSIDPLDPVRIDIDPDLHDARNANRDGAMRSPPEADGRDVDPRPESCGINELSGLPSSVHKGRALLPRDAMYPRITSCRLNGDIVNLPGRIRDPSHGDVVR